jgi:hypothetical protein
VNDRDDSSCDEVAEDDLDERVKGEGEGDGVVP